MAASKKTSSKKTAQSASSPTRSAKKTARKVAAGKSAAKKVGGSAAAGKAVKKTPASTPAKKAAAGKKTVAAGTKKAAVRKSPARKAPARKTGARKAAAKKAPSTAAKKSGTTRRATSAGGASKKTAAAAGKGATSPPAKKAGSPASTAGEASLREREEMIRKRTRKESQSAASSTNAPAFTLGDVREYLSQQKASTEAARTARKKGKGVKTAAKKTARKAAAPVPSAPAEPRKSQAFGAASVADLLGFDPTQKDETALKDRDEKDVPKKFLPYFRALLKLHEEVLEGLHRHSEETLRRSSKEDSGDLSSYGQHMADAGTESYERDFALSLVSSEQDALYEIDEALRRIHEGTYGVCEITGKPISRERLRAVPFTRYSVEGQREVEKRQTRQVQRAGIQSSLDGDESPVLRDDESSDE
jgi:RNA polymerase-binding transcription factor DksA